MLEKLRKLNPSLKIFSVNDSEFCEYGRVIADLDTAGIIHTAQKIAMPESGSKYEASTPAFEALDIAAELTDKCFGQLDAQTGYCYGHNSFLNALEWHTSSEVNIAVTDIVLILARRQDLDAGCRMDSSDCRAFYVPQGTAVEVYADTLHFCPCEVKSTGFGCVVVLPRGTNTPLEDRPHDKLLWAKNKWLISHNDNTGLLSRGAVAGISGENYRVNY